MNLTIIVPTYNRVVTLKKTLDSIKSLKYSLEIIVVDNGSFEETNEFLTGYSLVNKNVRPLRIPINTGSPAGPYNLGVAYATGEYCCFMYDDDTFIDGFIDVFMDRIYDQRFPMYYFNCSINNTDRGSTIGLKDGDRVTFDGVLTEEIKGESHIVIKTDILKKHKFPEHMLYSEGFVWFDILREHTPFFHDIKVRKYNRNSENISDLKKMFSKNIDEVIKQQLTLIQKYNVDLRRLNLLDRRIVRVLFLSQFSKIKYAEINRYLDSKFYFRLINVIFKILGRKLLFLIYRFKLIIYPNI